MKEKKMHSLQTFLLHLIALYTLSLSVQSCMKQEREALLKFKAGVHDPSNRLISWSGNKCCNWEGIRCNNQTGRVTKLDLSNSFSYLKYHGYKNHLNGKITPSLLALSALEYLDLSWNNFGDGAKIPDFIGKFKNLKYLNLSSSVFSGNLPPQLGNLTELRSLDLSNNVNIMASADISWISNLQSLRYLDMSHVNLKESREWLQTMNKIQSLEVLILDNNSFTHIPQTLPFVNFTSLSVLHLTNQDFGTPIPDWVFGLRTLTELNFEQSHFEGNFPAGLGNLTSLSTLVLGCSALQGELPVLNNLTKLTFVDLSCIRNGQPVDIDEVLGKFSHEAKRKLEGLVLYDTHLTGNLTGLVTECKNLKYLDLCINQISGSIPNGFWNLTNLVQVDLSYNSLSGSLTDAHLNHLLKLEVFLLGQNKLEGKIPTPPYKISVFDLSDNKFEQFPDPFEAPNLQEFCLNDNRISGTINFPLCRFTSLWSLILSSNNISHFHTDCFPDNTQRSLNCSDLLREIYLNNNSFTGGFPSFLQHCRGLMYLDLGENGFDGEIPQWVGENLNKLMILRLHSNLFSGNIPSKLALLNKLRVLDLSGNNLSGPILENLGNFTGMSSLKNVLGYVDDPPFKSMFESTEEFYVNNESWYLYYSTKLDLSNNYLTGNIPNNLSTLRGLTELNLSNNQLTGEIPRDIGEMISLQSLDFHSNNLSGTIPASISALDSLRALNLSYNNLSGRIPTGPQLQRLNGSSYVANLYLCGPPLQEKNCAQMGTFSDSNENSGRIGNEGRWWLYVGTELGFVVGCFAVLLVVLFGMVTYAVRRYGKK